MKGILLMITFYIGTTSVTFTYDREPTSNNDRVFFTMSRLVEAVLYNKLVDYVYDFKRKRFVLNDSFYKYSTKDNYGIIPIAYYEKLKEDLLANNIKITENLLNDFSNSKSVKINFKFKSNFVDKENQTAPINFLINSPNPQRALSLQTGIGKTYCALKAACTLNKPLLVITSKLTSQWYNEIVDKIDIEEKYIYTIKGFKTIHDLMTKPLAFKPTIFVASLETLRDFAQGIKTYEDVNYSYADFLSMFSIGTKIIDECHDTFHAIVMIDLFSNIEHNLYLSASYLRTNESTKVIFNKVFHEGLKHQGDIKKYTDFYIVNYNMAVPLNFINRGGFYSHINYEKALLRDNKLFSTWYNNVIKRLVDEYYISRYKKGQKLLIIVSLKITIQVLVDELKLSFPDMDIRPFASEDPDDNLNADIIVSTYQSAGTGIDIKGLITLLQTTSLKAEKLSIQIPGRLRETKDGTQTIFIDINNTYVMAQKNHMAEKLNTYKLICAKLHYRKL